MSERGIVYDLEKFDCKCKNDGRKIILSRHVRSHMIFFEISPEMLCDMIQNPIPCGSEKGKPHRKTSKRICAMRKKTRYNLIFDPFICQNESCWIVSNMEPLR
jgi:hypothetical protein